MFCRQLGEVGRPCAFAAVWIRLGGEGEVRGDSGSLGCSAKELREETGHVDWYTRDGVVLERG